MLLELVFCCFFVCLLLVAPIIAQGCSVRFDKSPRDLRSIFLYRMVTKKYNLILCCCFFIVSRKSLSLNRQFEPW